jgi:hypothetical protein
MIDREQLIEVVTRQVLAALAGRSEAEGLDDAQ